MLDEKSEESYKLLDNSTNERIILTNQEYEHKEKDSTYNNLNINNSDRKKSFTSDLYGDQNESLKTSSDENFEEEYTGYISVRDFAYDAENPMHYGYLEEDEYVITDDEDVEYSDKRKSYTLPREYIINKRGIALYDFENLNDNELPLKKNDLVFINYKHGQGWLVVQRLDESGEAGLVPEDYVEILDEESTEEHGTYTVNEDDVSENKESSVPNLNSLNIS
ncbi:hypothetical protein QEN19_001861 [Hanseniaspora menglaensis]